MTSSYIQRLLQRNGHGLTLTPVADTAVPISLPTRGALLQPATAIDDPFANEVEQPLHPSNVVASSANVNANNRQLNTDSDQQLSAAIDVDSASNMQASTINQIEPRVEKNVDQHRFAVESGTINQTDAVAQPPIYESIQHRHVHHYNTQQAVVDSNDRKTVESESPSGSDAQPTQPAYETFAKPLQTRPKATAHDVQDQEGTEEKHPPRQRAQAKPSANIDNTIEKNPRGKLEPHNANGPLPVHSVARSPRTEVQPLTPTIKPAPAKPHRRQVDTHVTIGRLTVEITPAVEKNVSKTPSSKQTGKSRRQGRAGTRPTASRFGLGQL